MVLLGALAILSLQLLSVSYGQQLEAVISMSNMKATVTFTEDPSTGEVTIITEFTQGYQPNLQWAVHEFPLLYSTVHQRCSEASIGIQRVNLTSLYQSPIEVGPQTPTAGASVSLTGQQGIAGRSLLITGDNFAACATIQRRAEGEMAVATVTGAVAGTVEYREIVPGHVTVLVDLHHTGPSAQTSISLDVYGRGGATPCGSGTLIISLGSVTPGLESGSSRVLYVVTDIPYAVLTNSYTGVGGGQEAGHCAETTMVSPKTVSSVVSMNGISGSMTFSQRSPYHLTDVSYTLQGLLGEAGGFHVHQYPLPYKYSAEDDVCSSASVGGHFNPLNAVAPANAITEDFFEIGDLSGKYGSLEGSESVSRAAIDWNLPLYGPRSIVGRSIVIHRASPGAPRWACSDVGYPSDSLVTAEAVLVGDVIGRVLLRQEANNPFSDTTVSLELSYTTGMSATDMHGIHVHTEPVDGDALAESGRCSSTQGHYNPIPVSVSSGYELCGPNSMLRCEIGDLSNKHGTVSVGQDGAPWRLLATDTALPLSGEFSVLGRSVVLHRADGSRLACANIVLRREPSAAVCQWVGLLESVTGEVGVSRVAKDVVTQVSVDMQGLGSLLGGYHVHQYPTVASLASQDICSSASVGGHYNPFGIVGSPATGTHDQYEIGDISGKFGPLTGLEAKTAQYIDTNMPTRGVNSVVGRSVVLHSAADGSRQACGNIDYKLAEGVRKIEAVAEFTGDIVGTVRFTNLLYPDGTTVDTTVTVDLSYSDGSVTQGHNWHVHRDSVTGDCGTTGPHYNPFLAPITESRYSQLCSPSNPLYCELGDMSSKHEQYSIGGGRRTYTDVNVPLTGPYSVLGRSVVFHAESSGAPRVACADIVPVGHRSVFHAFSSSTTFSRDAFLAQAASSVAGWQGDAIVGPPRSVPSAGCQEITIYFPESTYQAQVNALLGSRDNLGVYSTADCLTSEGDLYCNPSPNDPNFQLKVVPGSDRAFFAYVVGDIFFGVLRCPSDLYLNTDVCVCDFRP